jgi:hypothetical protein
VNQKLKKLTRRSRKMEENGSTSIDSFCELFQAFTLMKQSKLKLSCDFEFSNLQVKPGSLTFLALEYRLRRISLKRWFAGLVEAQGPDADRPLLRVAPPLALLSPSLAPLRAQRHVLPLLAPHRAHPHPLPLAAVRPFPRSPRKRSVVRGRPCYPAPSLPSRASCPLPESRTWTRACFP